MTIEPSLTDLPASQANLDVLMDIMPQMVWSTRPDGFHDYYNARWYEFTGVPQGSTDGEGWAGLFHPGDQDRAWQLWRHSLATGEPYEVEYRLRHHSGEYRWTLGRALPVRDPDGTIKRWIGTCTDVDAAKRASELSELLSQELSHRIKNIFAVIAGLIGLSVRQMPEAKAFATDLRERIAALGRAHEFVRPHSEQSRPVIGETTLKGMLGELFKPYLGTDRGQIEILGDDLVIDDRGATPLALLFHELATNAVKYGALSTPDGQITIGVSSSNDVAELTWTEKGGPLIEHAPTKSGFGTRLAEISVHQQMGGVMTRDWRKEGLHMTIAVSRANLSRAEPS